MSGRTEVNGPHNCRLILKYPLRFHRRPIPAKAAVVHMVFNWDIERRLFKLPCKGTRRVFMEERELFGDVVDTYASGESVGAGCAQLKVRASCGVGEIAKPGGFEDW